MLPINPPDREGKRTTISIPDPDEIELRRQVAEYAARKKAREPLDTPRAAIVAIVAHRSDLVAWVPSEIVESMR